LIDWEIITEPCGLMGRVRHFAGFTGIGWVHVPAKQGVVSQ